VTQKGKTNHYNVKLLKGYGFSSKVKKLSDEEKKKKKG